MQELMKFIEMHFYLIIGGTTFAIFLLSRLRQSEDVIYAFIAYMVFASFLVYIIYTVPFFDLSVVVVGVLILTAVDFIQTLREGNSTKVDEDPGPDRAT
ncbi:MULTISPECIES: hypothetical protein [Limibacillus]|jgi:predicted membrane-bound mannosyltransferase|uniref:Putative membrane-bound mannosyltransferase n=1 Tax=Limibacillus halophilus TaxID=1579333 RepID=A0A839SWV1_9PROT|nr:hypothetical protein [Limibacillus halophilus]MBB3065423.1 putative membrane-bound mannosyltransferase [Limibacillus halophilus]